MTKRAIIERESGLNPEELGFLARARGKFIENTDWFQFEDFAFGMRSPVFSKTRSHKNVLENPLYIALKDMWLELGVRQGRIAAGKKGTDTKDAPRGKARRRR
jgi:hypothetical protein